jgi:DNA-binding MarR family transcriptional regulator
METIDNDRRHRVVMLKAALREVNNQISLLSHRVSTRAALNNVDLNTLDYLSQHGAMSASTLAKGIGLHPATMTGVLDRLEKGGWIVRSRSEADRRAIVVSIDARRNADLFELYSGMDSQMNGVVADFSDEQLATITEFLQRTAEAGRVSTEQLDA